MLKIILDKATLKKQYLDEDMSQEQLALFYKCSRSVICTNLKDFGIKARPKSEKKYIYKYYKKDRSRKNV